MEDTLPDIITVKQPVKLNYAPLSSLPVKLIHGHVNMTADLQDVTQRVTYLHRPNIRHCSIVSSTPKEWGEINLREPSQSSLKCPQSVADRVAPPHLPTHGSPRARLLCSLLNNRDPFAFRPLASPDHLLSHKGLAQYGRSCAPDLLPLSLLRRLVLFGRSSPTRLVPASAPTHRIGGHRQWARGNRSSQLAQSTCHSCSSFLSALSVAYY